MNREKEDSEDYLIDEVRQRRREISAELGHDIRRLLEELKRSEAEHPDRVVDPRTKTRR